MYRGPFDFNGDGKMDAFESAAEFAFLNDLLQDEKAEGDCSSCDAEDDDWDD